MQTAAPDKDVLGPEIDRLADSLAIQWPGIDKDDIRQEMWIKVCQNWEAVSRHEDAEKIALGLAKKAGQGYCSNERYFYQAQTAEWIYTPAEVRHILAQYYFDNDAWTAAPTKPQAGRQTVEADGLSIALIDVKIAIERLSEAHQAILIRAFHGAESLSAGDRKRLQRAVDNVVKFLNRQVSQRFDHSDHDGPGSRKAISNSQARFITSNNY